MKTHATQRLEPNIELFANNSMTLSSRAFETHETRKSTEEGVEKKESI